MTSRGGLSEEMDPMQMTHSADCPASPASLSTPSPAAARATACASLPW